MLHYAIRLASFKLWHGIFARALRDVSSEEGQRTQTK